MTESRTASQPQVQGQRGLRPHRTRGEHWRRHIPTEWVWGAGCRGGRVRWWPLAVPAPCPINSSLSSPGSCPWVLAPPPPGSLTGPDWLNPMGVGGSHLTSMMLLRWPSRWLSRWDRVKAGSRRMAKRSCSQARISSARLIFLCTMENRTSGNWWAATCKGGCQALPGAHEPCPGFTGLWTGGPCRPMDPQSLPEPPASGTWGEAHLPPGNPTEAPGFTQAAPMSPLSLHGAPTVSSSRRKACCSVPSLGGLDTCRWRLSPRPTVSRQRTKATLS